MPEATIIGTNLSCSIVSGALSRAGFKVNHLDFGEYYGSQEFRMLSFEQLLLGNDPLFKSHFIQVKSSNQQFTGIQESTREVMEQITKKFNIPESSQEAFLISHFLKIFNNRYQFDLLPKVVFSKGPLVNLIIKAGIGEGILEFQLIKDVYFSQAGSKSIERVPCSKEDVFVDQSIPLREKRLLMKFFKSCVEYTDQEMETTKSFTDYIHSFNLSKKYSSIISSCLTFNLDPKSIKTLSAHHGIMKTKQYLNSIGRFGPGALLTGIYGTGSELCQSFCRYSAVFGGTMALGCKINSIKIDESLQSLDTDLGEFKSDVLVIAGSALKPLTLTIESISRIPKKEFQVSHLVLIGFNPLLDSTSGHCLQIYPPNDDVFGIFGIQYTSDTKMCPDGTCKSSGFPIKFVRSFAFMESLLYRRASKCMCLYLGEIYCINFILVKLFYL